MAGVETPFVLHGGCGCHAIRYRISVPALKDRPNCFYDMSYDPKSGKEPKYRFPFTCLDHCNDCRTHTGSMVNYWIIQPIEWCEYSCADPDDDPHRASGPSSGPGEAFESPEAREKAEAKRKWFKAEDVALAPTTLHYGKSPLPFLSFWASSPGHCVRTFCNRCGTSLSYTAHGVLPPGWTLKPIDFQLGTLDRDDLQRYRCIIPKEQLWGGMAVDWAKDMAMGKSEMSLRSGYRLDEP
ncbi:hypothetical protein NA57DRAFT_81199 [Rhizodiscina lignyota]|uniref:CENP-V/GFA domain-containing protein n=1 Tax=Rhizodiscina lignyota TaxID=1504668 RepID=A0A9P4I5T2_9PEZI|nr:hypothetical protein NA57DRAFT_81199 [Rhizodiscina lignyota]